MNTDDSTKPNEAHTEGAATNGIKGNDWWIIGLAFVVALTGIFRARLTPDLMEPQPKEPPAPDFPPNVIGNEAEQATAPQHQPDHERPASLEALLRQLADDKRSTRFHNWVTTIIGIVGAFIIGGQLWVTQGQLTEMKTSSADTRQLAESAIKQADNTEKLAGAAIEQVHHLEASTKATQDLAVATQRTVNETSKLVSLSQDPIINVYSQNNSVFLHKDADGKYPVFLRNSGHTGVKEVKFYYTQMAIQETDDPNNLSLQKGISIGDLIGIEEINSEQIVPFRLDFNNVDLNEVKFKIDSTKLYLQFYYLRITYMRELDNKPFFLEKVYYLSGNKDNSRLLDLEMDNISRPSKGIIISLQNWIKTFRSTIRYHTQ